MRSFKHSLNLTGLTIFMVVVGFAVQASAQGSPRPNVRDNGNRWIITGYDDASLVHAQLGSQGICFLPYVQVGTHIRGIWYSDTFPGWSGRYSQEGDRVLMHGNWGNFIGSDGMVIELSEGTSPKDVGEGQWTEWWNFGQHGTTVGFANARLRRVGSCPIIANPNPTQAELEQIATDRSRSVPPRMRKDGKQAESPTDPESVPLPEENQ